MEQAREILEFRKVNVWWLPAFIGFGFVFLYQIYWIASRQILIFEIGMWLVIVGLFLAGITTRTFPILMKYI